MTSPSLSTRTFFAGSGSNGSGSRGKGNDEGVLRQGSEIERTVREILRGVLEGMKAGKFASATYRLQFHREFTFRDAAEVVPYLNSLGVTHVYASPYLKSHRGSPHGYDVVDPTVLNPELGSEADFLRFVAELRDFGMGHILDFVPNHMGVGGDDNPWWQNVLENGPSSPYAAFFDVNWHPLKPDLANKVLLPVLGEQWWGPGRLSRPVASRSPSTFNVCKTI